MTEFVIDTCKAQKGRETLIYVLSDIHGNTSRFHSVLNQITWGENDWLYVLGDMADRGADGIAIMEELMHRPNTVWYRVQPEEKLFSDRITVFGHTPTEHFQSTMPMSVWYGDHRIAIDCGAAYEEPGCRLACVRLDDGKIFYSEENAQLV